jgi:hypothetical protein
MANWGQVELVVVDSLSSLAGNVSGDADGWTGMQRFVAFQRRVGRAVLLVHHAKRDGAMRGTSRRLDMMDLVNLPNGRLCGRCQFTVKRRFASLK